VKDAVEYIDKHSKGKSATKFTPQQGALKT
jgi:hypothetical protein